MENPIVRKSFTYRMKVGEPKQTASITFDFTNCSEKQQLEMMMSDRVIYTQGQIRSGKLDLSKVDTINVSEQLSNRHVGKSKVEKVKVLLSQVSDEEKADLIKQMTE